MNMRRSILVAALALSALVACSSDAEVGDDSLLDFKDSAQQELGKRTTTTAAPGEGGATTTSSTVRTTASTSRSAVTQAPRQDATFTISINADTGDVTGFDPPSARVTSGTVVEWVNRDHQARSVREDQGAFDSGPIPPGGRFTWRAAGRGRFGYSDGTRPYTVGQIDVVAA